MPDEDGALTDIDRNDIEDVARLLNHDPDYVATLLGFTLGGKLYRKGGEVQAYYIAREDE